MYGTPEAWRQEPLTVCPRWCYVHRARVMTLTTVVVLCLVCSTGCAGTSREESSSDSGVSGLTVVDRGCAALRGSTPCPTEPLRARVEAVRAGSTATAGWTESDADGRFRLALAPGQYVLHPQNLSGAPVPTAMPVAVEVRSGSYVEVTLQFDSGVRGPT
jgi:hypothetical protein